MKTRKLTSGSPVDISASTMSALLSSPKKTISLRDLSPEDTFMIGSPQRFLPTVFAQKVIAQENAERANMKSGDEKKITPAKK